MHGDSVHQSELQRNYYYAIYKAFYKPKYNTLDSNENHTASFQCCRCNLRRNIQGVKIFINAATPCATPDDERNYTELQTSHALMLVLVGIHASRSAAPKGNPAALCEE